MKPHIALLCWSLILLSCKDGADETMIYASACAAKNSDGEIVECETDSSESDDLHKFLLFSIELDKSHPGPEVAPKAEYLTVKSITPEAHIILENGIELALAGLKCNAQDLGEYLSAVFMNNEPYKVVYQLSGYMVGDVQFAYVWEIMEIDFSEAEDLLGSELGPSLSPTNETAITSEWCTPVKQPKHQYHERYAKIAKQIE